MGPKKDVESKKTEKKKQDKVIEDRTFGLKNKNKSIKVQKYIKGVEQTVKGTSNADQFKVFQDRAEKKKQKEEEAFLNSLYKTVSVVKQKELEEGEESKNVLCQFFKAGLCEKGDECEFSHDLNIDFNQGTFDIYTDIRNVKKNFVTDSEINKIADEKEKKRSKLPQTSIICKYFVDAVQRKIYGLKWECPNGDECHYKHCLPKGFIIRTKEDKIQEEMAMEDYYNLEEQIDQERERVAMNGTPVNDKTFAEWKKNRESFKTNKKETDLKNKKIQTGIQLFRNEQNNFKDDENAEETIEREDNNQLEELNEFGDKKETKIRTEKEIMEELDENLKDMKVNEELFQDENLDALDDLEVDDEGNDKEDN
jgi:hypothetical protein